MAIERRDEGDVTILSLAGVFEAFSLPALGEEVDRLVDAGRTKVVFNVHRVEFMNSSALGFLMNTGQRLIDLDGEMVFSQPSPFFSSMLDSLGLGTIFETFSTDREAVAHLGRET